MFKYIILHLIRYDAFVNLYQQQIDIFQNQLISLVVVLTLTSIVVSE